MFAICNLSIIPLRAEPSDRSEIVSQILFGEHFEITEQDKQWSKVKLHFDDYEGWIDTKQCQLISKENYQTLCKEAIILNTDLVEYISAPDLSLIHI
jgi:uncharacterized protein YgiM (DUF1202 family)